MATALKLRSDIKKLKKALDTKGISASIKDKLKSQLAKAENELASMKKGKKPTVSSTGGTKTALTKLQSLIKKKKFGVYQGQGVDLKKDADRPALPTGKRKSKSGNTYYEYRANRIDVKQPPKRFPKLEDGGMMADGGKIEVGDKVKYKNAKYHATVERVIYDEPIPYAEIRYADGKEGKAYLEDLQKVELRMAKEYVNPDYMAGGGNVSKSYEKIEGTDYELKIQVYYDKGGMNYFTSRPEARGYYLSVSPVQVERRDNGIMVESYAAFSGIKALVLPVQRQSPKAEKQAEELAQKMMPELKEQVTSNLKRKLGMMAEGGSMEMRDVVTEEQQMAKGGQIDDLLAKQTEFLAQLTDIKLGADLETEEGVLNYRNQISPIREKLSVIEDELEMLGYEAYEKGGYMKKGGLTLGDISNKYDENEDINYHTENVVLLATHFGTADELRDAKTIKAKHDAIGHLPFNLYQERNELGDKLYQRMQEQIRENGMGAKPKKMAKGGYMAKGGEMHRYEKGGYMAGGGKTDVDYSGEYFSIREFVETHDGMDKVVAEKYKIPLNEVDDNLDGELGYDTEIIRNLIKGKGYKVSYDNKSELIIVKKKMADGGNTEGKQYAIEIKLEDGEEMAERRKRRNADTRTERVEVYSTPEEAKEAYIKYKNKGEYEGIKIKRIEYVGVYDEDNFKDGGYMAKGGALEHGLKKGDHIMVIKGNMLGIKNEITGDLVTLNIETGERKETKE